MAEPVLRRGVRADTDAICALLRRAFPDNAKGRREVLDWQYWDNPFGPPTVHVWYDGGLPGLVDELTGRVERAVAEHGATRVLVPWFLDGHRDHQAVSRAVADADLPEHVEVWGFEWWTPLTATRLVDVTAVWPRKQAAAQAHATASLAFDVTAGLALSRWRALSGLHGQGYGEAFLALPHREYRQVSRTAVDGG